MRMPCLGGTAGSGHDGNIGRRAGRYTCNKVPNNHDDTAVNTQDRASTAPDTSSAYKSAMVQLVCTLYGLTIIILSIVLSVSAALQYHNSNYDSIYLQCLQVYLFVSSLMFLAYVHLYMLRHSSSSSSVNNDDQQVTEAQTLEKSPKDLDEGLTDGLNQENSECKDLTTISLTVQQHVVPPLPSGVTFDAQDVNFYLRLGAIVFGIGTMVQDGFHLSQLLQDGQLSFRCVPPFNILVIGLHVIFTFLQTYYIFKSHRIVAHRQKCIVRFGFVHLVTTNVAVWICTAVSEIHTDYQIKHYSVAGATQTGVINTTVMSATLCDRALTLSRQASPYLYPCTVQYSLIAAAIICQMYRNIGHVGLLTSSRHVMLSAEHDTMATHNEMKPHVDCDKAHRGLFLGLFILVLTLVAVSCYFVVGQNAFNSAGTLNHELYASFIFYTTALVLLVVSLAAVVIAAAKFRQLRFVPASDVDVSVSIFLETSLLVSALTAVTLLECFRAVSAVSVISDSTKHESAQILVTILSAVTSGTVFVQSAVQTVFVIDAMRRVVRTPGQQRRKPGRTLVTFLLLANVSMFVVTIFDVNRPEDRSIHVAIYGQIAWSIVTRITFPLTIFYRFHAVVCLSDIWSTAYKLKEK